MEKILERYFFMPSKKQSFELSGIDKIVSILEAFEGVYHLSVPDEFTSKIICDSLAKKAKKLWPHEFSLDFIEQELLAGGGLFGPSGPFIIIDAQDIKANAFETFNNNRHLINESIIFITKGRLPKGFPKDDLTALSLSAPKPWHFGQYLDVFAKYFGFQISPQIKNFIEKSVPDNASDYFNCCHILSHHVDERGAISLEKAKSLIKVKKLDFFDQADLFNQSNLKRFYLNLLLIEDDFGLYLDFFRSFQGHVNKVIDPSYLAAKKSPSKYDRGIQLAARKWDFNELIDFQQKMINFEIMAKSKDFWLRDCLRREYLGL
ncbi:hypothetical protein ABMA77_07370 [Halobacteriovorax sp. RZ-1]|uniref:hypothetical protein n=2 Tax=Halobacteriovorax TaxID=1652133 RepID=UPI00371A8107